MSDMSTSGDRFVGGLEFQEFPELDLWLGDTYEAAPGSWSMEVVPTPVPLPASLGGLLLGLGVLAGLRGWVARAA